MNGGIALVGSAAWHAAQIAHHVTQVPELALRLSLQVIHRATYGLAKLIFILLTVWNTVDHAINSREYLLFSRLTNRVKGEALSWS